jgi:carboxypeptidase T
MQFRNAWCAFFVLAVAATGLGAHAAPPSRHYLLVSIKTQADDIQRLHDLGLDVWSYEADGGEMEIRVSPEELNELRAMGFDPLVVDPDVYATAAAIPRTSAAGGPWSEYHTLDAAYELLDELAADHPSRAEVFTAGYSLEGRPIRGIRINSNAGTIDATRPAFFIVGCHHAREWISVEVPLYIAQQLLEHYDVDAQARALVDRGEIWIVPILNPDGYVYTHEADRLWRNNRRPFENGRTGVDLNRNYSYQWGRNQGSSAVEGTATYRGAYPFSEPETQAIRDLFELRQFMGAISYHSYGKFVLSPWGYTTLRPPDDHEMSALATEMASMMNGETSNPWMDYESGRIASGLYVASGVFEDWVYGLHGSPAIAVELPPISSPGFLLPPEEILPTCVENFESAVLMMEWVFGPATHPPGDFDFSGSIDMHDHMFLTVCLTGPDASPSPFPMGCYAADLNHDGRVDLADLARLRQRRPPVPIPGLHPMDDLTVLP